MTAQNMTGYPSIDKPWLKYYTDEAINAPLPEGSMYDYMTARNSGRLDSPALNYFGRKITHRQLQTEIDRCARALTACGVKSGDVVSLCLLSMPEAVYLLYAVNKLGAVANFLVLNATPQELHEQIAVSQSKVVITVDVAGKQIAEAVKDTSAERVVSVSLAQSMPPVTAALYRLKAKTAPSALTPWRKFIEAGKNVDASYPAAARETAAVIEYTGGTTGKAKGVLISNGAANAVAFQYIVSDNLLDFEPGQRLLGIIPPFLAYGVFLGLHMPLCAGLEVVLCPDPSPARFAAQFARYKPNHFSGGPLHIESLMKSKRVRRMDMSFLRVAAYGGDAMSEEWEHAASQFLKEHKSPYGLLKGYGMTETDSTLCFSTNRVPEMIPLPRNNFRVLDIDTGEELGYGLEGEICVTGPTLMLGYCKNEAATKEIIFEENGVRWLRTGDLGHITPEGYFCLTGRLKRIFWGVGPDNTPYRIYPMEIERVLCTCPEVESCAAVGKPNRESGYIPIAYIVPAASADRNRLEEKLRLICDKELHGNAVPHAYHFIDKLPTTPAGKVDFRALERMAAEGENIDRENDVEGAAIP